MRELTIHGRDGDSRILVGERLRSLPDHLPGKDVIVITDHNIWNLYRNQIALERVIRIGTGESIKTLDTVRDLYGRLLEMEADRSTFLVAIGGGIVCDIVGFVASTYMRGLRFGFVASSLLAQVDAGVGGKNGVNYQGYKNIVGVFNQPEFVICDMQLLQTLPQKECACGFAEIVKHAAIADAEMFALLEDRYRSVRALDPVVIEKLVYTSLSIKAAIVNRDEREAGQRRVLNFGHTIAHALEALTDLSHGEAVSIGMVAAARISKQRGLLSDDDCRRLDRLLDRLRLPITANVDAAGILNSIRKDKKRRADGLHFILLKSLGQATVEEISLVALENYIRGPNLFS